MLPYLRLELMRLLRDRRFLAFTTVMPIAYYLLFTSIGSSAGSAAWSVYFMVGMAGFGALAGAVSAGGGLATDRSIGWLRQLRVTPLPSSQVVAAKVSANMVAILPALVPVCVAAAGVHGVRLAAWQWVALVGLLWAGALPFALLGLAIGYLASPLSTGPLMGFGMFGLSLLGGMWFPVTTFPGVMQTISHVGPTYHYANLSWKVAFGQAPAVSDAAVLVAWAALFAIIAMLGYRRTSRAW